jgi:hypothetical protein
MTVRLIPRSSQSNLGYCNGHVEDEILGGGWKLDHWEHRIDRC